MEVDGPVGDGQRQLASLRNVAERVVTVSDLGVPRPWGPQPEMTSRDARDVMASQHLMLAWRPAPLGMRMGAPSQDLVCL
jgi:hypothetical protein